MQMQIDWSDPDRLDQYTREVRVDGQLVSQLGWSYVSGNDGRTGTYTGSVALTLGTHTVSVKICDQASPSLCSTKEVTYHRDPAPETGTRATPAISTALHHGAFRDVTIGSSVLSYTTPAYVSWDEPRALTVFYASGQAQPMGFVQVEVTDNSTERPEAISIEVRRASDNVVVSPERFYADTATSSPTPRKYRLAAQWSNSADTQLQTTGAYLYDVVVRSYWASGTVVKEATEEVRVVSISAMNSPLGRGWSFAGMPRLYEQADGVVIDEGDGTAWFYEPAGGCTFVGGEMLCPYSSPEGDFSTVWAGGLGGAFHRRHPDGSVEVFASNGWLEYVEDRFGNRTTFTYDAYSGYITDPAGKQIEIRYSNGRIDWIRDPGNRYVWFTMNPGRQPLHVMEPDSSYALQNITYNTAGRVTGWQDAAGGQWDANYDTNGTLASVQAPQVGLYWGGASRPTTNLVSLQSAILSTSSAGGSRTNPAVAAKSNLVRVSVTDHQSYTTLYELDRFGLPTYVRPPLGAVTRIHRNQHGLPETVESAQEVVNYEWDEQGRLKSREVAGDAKRTTIAYDPTFSDLALPRTVSVGQAVTHYRYGSSGELRKTWSGAEADSTNATTYLYNADYRPTRITDAQGHGTVIAYATSGWENADHVDSYGTGPTQRTTFVYDAYGRAVRARSLQGDSTVTTYDLLNRVTSERDPLGQTTSYTYTGPFLTRVTDAAGKHYDFRYNVLGWLTSEVRPGSADSLRYGYDGRGMLRTRTDRRGKTVSMTYDALGRMVSRTADGQTTTYAFDSLRWPIRWRSAQNSVSTDTIFYDDKGRPEREVTVLGGKRYDRTFEYQYEGMRTRMTMTSPWTDTLSLGYVVDGRIRRHALTDLEGNQSTFGYNAEGLPYSVSYETSYPLTVYTARDARHLPIAQTLSIGALNTAFGADYAYDHYGRMTRRTGHGNPEFLNTGRIFSYDASGQLTGFQDEEYRESIFGGGCGDFDPNCEPPVDTTVVRSVTYGYDAAGNRTDSNASLVPGTNRYSSFNGYTLGYDAEGNLTSKSGGGVTRTYTWNALGQLASVTSNGSTVSFAYDGWGRRVRRTKGGVTTYQLYDGDDLLAEVSASGSPIRRYTHLPGVDRPHALHTGGQTYYYVQDVSGNVVGLVDSGGLQENAYEYTPFGELLSASEGVTNPLRYKGREWDADVGLYYVRARWYDPELGRFVSEDPIGIAGGINLLAFTGNDPVNYSDPSGLCVGEPYRAPGGAGATVCALPGLIVRALRFGTGAAPQWRSSRGGSYMDMAAGGSSSGRGGHGGRSVIDIVIDWNDCVSSTANENFRETNATLSTWAGRAGKQIVLIPVSIWASKKLGDSGLAGDAWNFIRNTPNVHNFSRSRMWVSRVGGRYVYGPAGRNAAIIRAGAKGVASFVALQTGIALGSTAVGLTECTF